MLQTKLPHDWALAREHRDRTAQAQRWEPTEVIKALFIEEAADRARSMLATAAKR